MRMHGGAVGRRCIPHLFIRGYMRPPQRSFTAGPRGKMKLAVALIPATGSTYVKAVSGTTCPDLKPEKQYTTKASKGKKIATSMTEAEYLDFIHDVLDRLPRRHGRVIWVHDRDSAHRGPAVAQLFRERSVTLMTLPPRSPDLDPLDYAVFVAGEEQEQGGLLLGRALPCFSAAPFRYQVQEADCWLQEAAAHGH